MIGKHILLCNWNLRSITIFLVLIFLQSHIYPQQIDLPFEYFSVEEGMATRTNNIFQDRTGYLWFATNNGLYKYDGYNFTSYQHDIDDSNSLMDNTITTLYEDKEGVLWIGSWVGLEKFDRSKNSFKHYIPNPSALGKDLSNIIWSMCEDRFGIFWVGSEDGLYKFDKATGKFTSLKYDSTDPGSISHNSVQAILEDNKGSLWFGTGAGLDRFDHKIGKFIHYLNSPDRNDLFHSMYWIKSMFQDKEGIIWLGTHKGLIEFNQKERTFLNYLSNPKSPEIHITSVCQDAITGSIWIAAWEGLFSFDIKSRKFTSYKEHAEICVFSERSGTLWIGTNRDIRKLNRTKQPFKKYLINGVTYVVKPGSEGIVWIRTYNSFKKFDLNKEQFIPTTFAEGDILYFIFSKNEMVVKSKNGGQYIIDTLGNISHIIPDSLKDFINSLSYACKTKKGIWFGNENGGFFFEDSKTSKITLVRNLEVSINFIFEDRLGSLWISTLMGKVFCYNPEKDSLAEFVSDPQNPFTISGRHVTQIYEDTKGRLWFATTNGLNRFDRSKNKFIRFMVKNGLAGNSVLGILEDDHGYLWINTNKGISKFDPEKNYFKNYDISYGLEPATDNFYGTSNFYGTGCRTKNGEMFFPGARGFTRFHPDSIKDNPFIPPVVITSFKVSDKPYPFSKQINLPYYENFISFEFVALSYINPERNQYAYKMEGLDKDWIYSGTRRYASYTNLQPGEYVFEVKGSNNDGVWNEIGTSVLIIISPPWWKTTYAYIFYSLLIISLIYFSWKMQVKRIKMSHEYEMSKFEAEKLHEVDEMKSRFFTNISHEFRTPLTLILGPVRKIIENTNEVKTKDELKVVHKNANRLLGLVNQLLDISKLESGNMKLQTSQQNIIPLLKALLKSFCSYAERKRITLKFNSEEDDIIVYIDKDKIEKIITNILSNAFKFTPEGGLVEVSIKPSPRPSKGGDNMFLKVPSFGGDLGLPAAAGVGKKSTNNINFVEISIKDTGVGIPKEKLPKIFDRFYQVDGSVTREQEGTGIGLALTKELVELHKGEIEVESEEGKGTTVTISLPLGKGHLKPEEICEPEKEKEIISFDKELISEEVKKGRPDLNLEVETGKPALLIIEDNSDVRNYIKNNLNKDYRILEAIDGDDGWNKSIQQIPDLIISDVMMPKIDGFKLCDKLKTDDRTSHIPVILLTAKASSQDKIEGLETGADDYIMKPFDTEELKTRIKNLIVQRKRIHEHFRKHGLFEIDIKNITPIDQKFIQKTFKIINVHISDTLFGVKELAKEMTVSRSLLLKKIEALIGESPIELIKRTRLNKAAKLIESKFGNVSEISLEVGFNNPSYFAECFKKQFGVTPSQYHHGQ